MKKNKALKIAIIIIIFLIIFSVLVLLLLKSTQDAFQNDNNGKVDLSITEKDEAQKDNKTEIEENEIIEEKEVHINSITLKYLINNSWSRINSGLSDDYEKDDDGNYVYDGYTLYSDNGVYIKNIIFNENYEEEVVGGLRVGAEYKEIVNALGEPTFSDETLNLCGYKTGNLYVFFYDDEISVYPNKNLNNSEFEKLLFNYIRGDFSGNQTNFVVELKNKFNDFSAALDGEDVVLTSANRQIKIKLNGNYLTTEVTLYNGYVDGTLMKEYLESINIKEERENDLVKMIEVERIVSK